MGIRVLKRRRDRLGFTRLPGWSLGFLRERNRDIWGFGFKEREREIGG